MTEIIECLVVVATAITMIFFILGRIDADKVTKIKQFIHTIVYAMEEVFPERKSGDQKLEEAERIIAKEYPKLSLNDIVLMVKAEVAEMNAKKREDK